MSNRPLEHYCSRPQDGHTPDAQHALCLHHFHRPRATRYGAAVCFLAASALLWAATAALPGGGNPAIRWLYFYPAVVAAACVGGLGPAILATLLGLLLGLTLPGPATGLAQPLAPLYMAVLVITGLGAGLWAERIRRECEAQSRCFDAMQKDLAISEQRLHSIFNQAAVGICLATFAGEMKMVNQKLCDLLGYGREELLKLSYKDITYPEDWPPQVALATRLRAGEIDHYSMEKRYIRKDGSLIWATLTCSSIPDEPNYVVAVVADITDRKHAEDALKRIQDRYSALFDRSLDCVYLLDFEGRFIDANPAALELLGYTREEIPTTDLATLVVGPEHMQHALERMEELRRNGRTLTPAEFKVRRKDGRILYVESKGSVILHDGKPFAIQGIARDITARKLAEAALRESEEKFRSMAEAMNAAVGIVQGKGFVYVNRCMSEMLGYGIDEILSMEFPQLVHPDDRARLIDLARRRQLGEKVPTHYEFMALTRSGETRWIDFSAAQILYRGQPAIVGTGFDVTERKLAENRLRAQSRGLRLLAETATRLLATEHPREVLHTIFDELADHIGAQAYVCHLIAEDNSQMRLYATGGLDGVAHRHLEAMGFEQMPCALAALERRRLVIDDVQQSAGKGVELLRQLGVRAYACHPLLAQGTAVGTLSFFALDRDHFGEDELELMRTVSYQAAMAMEHQRLRAELEHHAAELAEASHAKDHFMATLSHELRTPLTPVLAAAGVLEKEGTMPEQAREYLEIIRRNAELEARLIDDLLDVTRIVRGKIELNKHEVELGTVLSRAVEVCTEDITARGLHLRLDLGPSTPYWVEADADRLQQVFWNLLKNSIKFTPPGGCVGVSCHGENGQAIVEVTDSGDGIAPEALGRIFKPFEQAERSITRQFGGLGLGLAISKALVELHGGTISAHSPGKGRGATFRVVLPRVERVAQAEMGTPPETLAAAGMGEAHGAASRPLRILLVEDHGDTAKMLARLLRNEGYEVRHATDVATAQAMAEQANSEGAAFDLLLSDLGLPDASGNDLMRALRSHGQMLPGIALSGYGMASDMEQSRAAGFAEHVTKPVSFPVLKQAIVRTIRSPSAPHPGQEAR